MPKRLIVLYAAAFVSALLLTSAGLAVAQTVPPALSGKIASDPEGSMEGVLVSAK